jgi:hypothetical protein
VLLASRVSGRANFRSKVGSVVHIWIFDFALGQNCSYDPEKAPPLALTVSLHPNQEDEHEQHTQELNSAKKTMRSRTGLRGIAAANFEAKFGCQRVKEVSQAGGKEGIKTM